MRPSLFPSNAASAAKPLLARPPPGNPCCVAEQLAAVVYDAVAIPVPYEESIAATSPARSFREPVSFMIEIALFAQVGGFDAVPIQV